MNVPLVPISLATELMPCGINDASDRMARVCGANCPDGRLVAHQMREFGAQVKISGCLGGCATSMVLTEGTYAELPNFTADGILKSLVKIVI